MSKNTILFVGNHYKSPNRNRNLWFEIPIRLNQLGWGTIITSTMAPRLWRMLDMLWIAYSRRKNYQIAQVDVFSGPSFLWAELVVFLLRLMRKPIVLMLRGGNLPDFSQKHPSRVHSLLKSANQVIAPSSYLQEGLSDFREDIKIIPNPIELESYPYKHRADLRSELIWVRAFHEIYNPYLAVKVLSELVDISPDVQLIMVGPDKSDGSFQRTVSNANKLGLQNRIQFPGGVDRDAVPGWLSKGDIFINTTNFDNAPVSVIEAMACGLCIVSTNVGGIPFLLENEIDALLVPPDDPMAMAKAVERILEEPGLSGRLSANARKKAEKFSWSIVLPQWEEVFEEVINDFSSSL